MLSMKYRTATKTRSQEKTVLNYSSWLFLNEKTAQNTAKTSLSKEGCIEFLIKMYHAKVPSRTREKIRSQGKTVLKYSTWKFCPEMLPKTPSTVSKHSSEK